MTLPFHPLANLFPLIEGADFDALVESIKANGLRDPIIIHEGMVLDGRNRARACETAGIDAIYHPFQADQDALSFVIDKNLRRRHLNESQRAFVAAKLANLDRGANQHAPIGATSQEDAAARLNVSRRSVQRAAIVQEKGTTELQHAVEQGEVAASAAAEIAELPKGEQVKLVAQGEKKITERAKQLRENRAARKRKARSSSIEPESQHSLDLRLLTGAWDAACETARAEFLRGLGYSDTAAAHRSAA